MFVEFFVEALLLNGRDAEHAAWSSLTKTGVAESVTEAPLKNLHP